MHKLINNVHGRNDRTHGHNCRNKHFHRKTNNIFLPRKSLCPLLLALITVLILSMLISISVINGSDSILARSVTESVIDLLSLCEIHPSILVPVILAPPCKLRLCHSSRFTSSPASLKGNPCGWTLWKAGGTEAHRHCTDALLVQSHQQQLSCKQLLQRLTCLHCTWAAWVVVCL